MLGKKKLQNEDYPEKKKMKVPENFKVSQNLSKITQKQKRKWEFCDQMEK